MSNSDDLVCGWCGKDVEPVCPNPDCGKQGYVAAPYAEPRLVVGCGDCPFARYDDAGMGDICWLRAVGNPQVDVNGYAPDWCPLRQWDIVVRLEGKK